MILIQEKEEDSIQLFPKIKQSISLKLNKNLLMYPMQDPAVKIKIYKKIKLLIF